MSRENVSVMLVHGAWADGSSWAKVIGPLAAEGIRVLAAPLPLTSFAKATAAVERTVERVSGPVVLVGHAYEKSKRRYRLLSEAEYEYAERSGAETAYWWGDDPRPICSYVNTSECHYGGPTAIGSHRPNGFGLDDMTGNEFEWVQDCWHRSYDGAPDDGAVWAGGGCSCFPPAAGKSCRVMRGCAWFVDSAHMRAGYRNYSDSGNRSEVIGFRVARDL
jgi:formylglycine-generating enzyme required for sulfatase activity